MSAVFLELFNRAVSAGWMILALLILSNWMQARAEKREKGERQ